MYSIAMDVGKYKTYGIIDKDGEMVKGGTSMPNKYHFVWKFPE